MSKVTLQELGLGADDLAAIGKLSEKGMTPDEIADAVKKIHDVNSSASAIDSLVNNKVNQIIGQEVKQNTKFIDTNGWTLFIAGTGTPILENRVDLEKYNNISMKIGNSKQGNTSLVGWKKSFLTSMNLSDTDYFTMWIYVENQMVNDGETGSAYGYYMLVMGDSTGNLIATKITVINKGWNNVTILKSDFNIPIVGTVNWSDIKNFQLRYQSQVGASGELANINSFISGGSDIDKIPVVITMDDGFKESFEMTEIMNRYGIPVSLFVMNEVVDDHINNPDYFSIDDCKYLYNRGNHIGIHGATVNEFVNTKEKIGIAKDWLFNNGFTKDNGYLYGTYPNGSYNQATIDYAKSIGIKAMRTITVGVRNDSMQLEGYFHSNKGIVSLLNGGIADSFRIGSGKPINLATYTQELNVAIERKSAYITYHHMFSEFTNKSEWTLLAQYLKQKVDEGLIECLTFPQFCKKYS